MLAPLFVLGVAALSAAQNAAFGDLSRRAPFGLPPDAFRADTADPTVSHSYPVAGYNISSASSAAAGDNSVPGWTLAVAVKADVSLSRAANDSVDKSKVTQATTLGLAYNGEGGPMGFDTTAWRVCALVYRGLAADKTALAAEPGADDGTCAKLLPTGCSKALFVAASTDGIGEDGACQTVALPNGCEGMFADTQGTAFALEPESISDKRFYAFGSDPVNTGNKTALSIAEGNVWPVILTWRQQTPSNQSISTNSVLSCLRAGNATGSGSGGGGASGTATPSPSPTNDGGPGRRPAPAWLLPVAIGLSLLISC